MITKLGELQVDTSMIMAGRESSYFLLSNGSVKACGRNDEGQLGDGTFVSSEFTDVNIPDPFTVSNLGSGPSSQSVFFFGEEAVFGAGANDRFQLGLGEIGSQVFPVEVEFNDLETVAGIIKISSSGTQTVALCVPVDAPKKDTDIPTPSPSLSGTSSGSGIPTFSPTFQPTAKNFTLDSSIPTFSPTFQPTSGMLDLYKYSSFSMTRCVLIAYDDFRCSRDQHTFVFSHGFPHLPRYCRRTYRM